MADLQKQYETYRKEYARLAEIKEAWYTIASYRFSEGDGEGQARAFAEMDKVQDKIDALVDPRGAEDNLSVGSDLDLKF